MYIQVHFGYIWVHTGTFGYIQALRFLNTHIQIGTCTYRYVWVHACFIKCMQVHTGTFGYIWVHIGTFRYIAVHLRTHRYTKVQSFTYRYTYAHTGTFRFIRVLTGTHKYTGTHKCTQVHFKTYCWNIYMQSMPFGKVAKPFCILQFAGGGQTVDCQTVCSESVRQTAAFHSDIV